MTDLGDRLAALVAAARPLTLSATSLPLGQVLVDAPDVAAGPFAPLLAEALCASLPDSAWEPVAEPFLTGLPRQASVLHLSDTVDVLLTHPVSVRAHAARLLAVLLDDLSSAVARQPLLAAVRLTSAVRLALGGVASPFRVWDALEQLSVRDAPADFVEFLPRTVGAALDRWAGDATAANTLRGLLTDLAQLESSATDAQYELGCDSLRAALSHTDLAQVTEGIVQARRHFGTACADEARLDAQALSVACSAVLAFTRGDLAAVASTAGELAGVAAQRTAWLHGTHQPLWTRPRRSAEIAWQHLVLTLERAAQQLADPAWLNPWEALDQVLAAYSATRTTQPLGGPDPGAGFGPGTGLAQLVKPTVEDAFLRQQHLLALLERAIDTTQTAPTQVPAFDQQTAQALLARVRAQQARGADAGQLASPDGADGAAGCGDAETDGAGGDPVREVSRYAPTFLRVMGTNKALALATGVRDPGLLAMVEDVAILAEGSRYDASDPVVTPLLDGIVDQLSRHPGFAGEVRKTFPLLIHQTVLFLRSRLDLTQSTLLGSRRRGEPRDFDYRLRPPSGQPLPLEGDLHRDFHLWLRGGPLADLVSVEEIDVALGRADVVTQFGSLRYRTEVKKEDRDVSLQHLEAAYVAQAAEYGNTNVPFGQLLVLDLTPKTDTGGSLRLDELVWVARHRPAGASTDRLVVVGVLPANRLTPSEYSSRPRGSNRS